MTARALSDTEGRTMGKHRRKSGRKSASIRKPKKKTAKSLGGGPMFRLGPDGCKSPKERAAKLADLQARAAAAWGYLLFLRGKSAHPGHVVLVQDGDTIRKFAEVPQGQEPECASFPIELLEQFIQEAMQRGERVVVADWTFTPEGGRAPKFWVFRPKAKGAAG